MIRPSSAARRVRRAVLARRRSLAAVLAAVSVAATLRANAEPGPPSTLLLTAHDLAGGVVVRAEDLRRTSFLTEAVPAGTLTSAALVVGRTTAGPVRAGEAITDARLVTPSLLDGHPGLVALPVRIGDPAAVRLLRVGDRIDVLAANPQGGSSAVLVGRSLAVLAIPVAASEDALPGTGALVVLATPPASARLLAQASVSSFLSVVLTG
jgi:Flp pilus assembly protein CpaB